MQAIDSRRLDNGKAALFTLPRIDYSKLAPLLALLVLIIISALLSDHFLVPRNLTNVLRQVSYTGIIALGTTFVIIAGGIIDLIAFPSGAQSGTVDAGTIWWLGFAEGPGTSFFTIVGVLFYMRYRIDRRRHQSILYELSRRQKI